MRQLGVHHRYHRNVATPLVTNCTANGSVSPRLRTLLGDSQPREKWRVWGRPLAAEPQLCPSVPAALAGAHVSSFLRSTRAPASRVNSLQTTLLPWGVSEQISTPGPATWSLSWAVYCS